MLISHLGIMYCVPYHMLTTDNMTLSPEYYLAKYFTVILFGRV